MIKICKEQKIKEQIYNTKLIVILSVFLVVYSVGVTFLFDKPRWIRYAMVAVISLAIVSKKDILLKNLAVIKNQK